MTNEKTNHPRRKKVDLPGTPTPEQITAARKAAGINAEHAAALIMHTTEQWMQFELGIRRMHPIIWWAFNERSKVKG